MDEIDAAIGRRVRALRRARDMTQKGLADRIGVSFQQVQKYENGSNRISGARLLKTANILNVPASHFFDGLRFERPSVPAGAPDAPMDMSDALSMRMAVHYDALSEPLKMAVLALVESVSNC